MLMNSRLRPNTSWSHFPSRRSFVRLFAFLAASSILPGKKAWAGLFVAQGQAAAADGGVLRLKVSDFPPLQSELGSVRIGTSLIGGDHRPTGLFYPVIINRAAQDRFYALDSACTHEGCTVPTFDSTAGLMQCPCHGSQYGIDGHVQRGPANFPLRQFPVHFDGANSLTIELSDISFSLEPLQMPPGSSRLPLEFIAFDQLQYEVHYRPNAATAWTGPVPFAVTPEGPTDQTVLVGQANFARVYLDRATASGLYAVVMRVIQV